MDGWDREACLSKKCPANAPYAYVPPSEVRPYWEIARQYGFANRMFQTQQGPSFPAHQYLISGTSMIGSGSRRRAAENPAGLEKFVGGCDSKPGSLVMTIGDHGDEGKPVFPCFDRPSIFTLLDAAGLSWRYYQASTGSGLWNGVDALKPLCPTAPCDGNPEYSRNVVVPSARVLSDAAHGHLADLTFVTPTFLASDHASVTDGSGPDWVGTVVNAVGRSRYWKSTAIFVTWDDWGGWYDHVKPPIYDSFTDGFRVPLLVISPYAKRGYISNNEHDFGSLLKFAEQTFGLPSLGMTDARSDDLSDFFSFSRSPREFHPIPTRRQSLYFVANEWTFQPPDND
jgi:phospholipase C